MLLHRGKVSKLRIWCDNITPKFWNQMCLNHKAWTNCATYNLTMQYKGKLSADSSQRGEMVEIVSSLTLWSSIGWLMGTLRTDNAGCLGSGNGVDSLPCSDTTTADMLGLSAGSSWTHRRPTCMHFRTSCVGLDPLNKGSTNSSSFPSFHNLQACSIGMMFCDNIPVLVLGR